MSPHRFASVILVDDRGWLLLQERDEHPDIDPGKWGFVGGGVEDGEDFGTAAYRELGEETGVEIDDGLELWRHVLGVPRALRSGRRVPALGDGNRPG